MTNFPTSLDSFPVHSDGAGNTIFADYINDIQAAVEAIEGKLVGPMWLNPIEYGADPTGATDSTSAIQDAIDAAVPSPETTHSLDSRKAVVFPDGDYLINGTIIIPEGLNVIGQSREGTRLRMGWVDSLEKFKTYNDSLDTETKNFQFRNLTIAPDYEQDAPEDPATVFRLRYAIEASFQNIRIIQHLGAIDGGDIETLTAFDLDKCVDVGMQHVIIDGGSYGIRARTSGGSSGSRFGRFSNLFLYNQIEYGIDLADTSESNQFDQIHIQQPSARGTARTGMRIGTGCFNNVVTNLRSGGANQYKSLVIDGDGNVVTGAHLRASGTSGVALTVAGGSNTIVGHNSIGATTHVTVSGANCLVDGAENSVQVRRSAGTYDSAKSYGFLAWSTASLVSTTLTVSSSNASYSAGSPTTVTDIASTGIGSFPLIIIRNTGASTLTFTHNANKIRAKDQTDIVLAQHEAAGFIPTTAGVVQQVF